MEPVTEGPGQGGRLRPDLRTAVTIGLGVVLGLLLTDLFRNILGRLHSILVILLISLFLSFAMEPAVQHLARRGMRRGFGTFVVFLVSFLLAIGFIAAMLPLVIDQINTLVEQGPELVRGLSEQAARIPGVGESLSQWLDDATTDLPDRLPDLAGQITGGLLGLGGTLLGGLVQMLTIGLVTFYLVADGPRVRRALVSRLRPEEQREFLTMWELAVAKTGGYVYSRVVTAIVSAAFHAIVFTVVGLEYAIALGVWVGVVSSVIPVVGTYLAGFLPLLIALAGDQPADAIWVVGAIVVYQQVENYYVAPKITARTMELHPAVAFIAVLAGAALLGAVGALLALPVAAIVTALVSTIGHRHEIVEHELIKELDPMGKTDYIRTYGAPKDPDEPGA